MRMCMHSYVYIGVYACVGEPTPQRIDPHPHDSQPLSIIRNVTAPRALRQLRQ
jgi:hypothetical protein